MVESLVFGAGQPGLESQSCCFLAVSPWVSYSTYPALFPHLQNGVKGSYSKAFLFLGGLQNSSNFCYTSLYSGCSS